MCRPVPCRSCGLTTWSGCGAHVAQVRALVPADQWCGGHEARPEARPDAESDAGPRRWSRVARLLARGAER